MLCRLFHNMQSFQLRGYCVPLHPYDEVNLEKLAIVTDIGEPLDVIKLVRMSWTDRLELIKSITLLLQRLSPLTVSSQSSESKVIESRFLLKCII